MAELREVLRVLAIAVGAVLAHRPLVLVLGFALSLLLLLLLLLRLVLLRVRGQYDHALVCHSSCAVPSA